MNGMIREVRPEEDAAAIAEIYDLYVRTTAVSFETEALGEMRMRERIEGLVQEGYPYFVYEEDGGFRTGSEVNRIV